MRQLTGSCPRNLGTRNHDLDSQVLRACSFLWRDAGSDLCRVITREDGGGMSPLCHGSGATLRRLASSSALRRIGNGYHGEAPRSAGCALGNSRLKSMRTRPGARRCWRTHWRRGAKHREQFP